MDAEKEILKYTNKGFNKSQRQQIKTGLRQGLSNEQIKIFANPDFSVDEMKEIRWSLEQKLDVNQIKIFAKPEFSASQMYIMRLGIQSGINIKYYANPKLSDKEMLNIYAYLLRRKNHKITG